MWDREIVNPQGVVDPISPFLSTPNMDYIPDISKMSPTIIARKDSRFFTGDFSLMPQFYFEQTAYLPFVLRKPPPDELPSHKYSLVWHDLTQDEFLLEEGSVLRDVGRIDPFLVERFMSLRRDMQKKYKDLEDSNTIPPKDLQDFEIAVRGLLFTSVALCCAPQTWALTLLTVTTLQRYWHEAHACFEYLSFWKKRPITAKPYAIDKTIMGALTADIFVALELHQMGVPVWLLRPPSQLPADMNIGYRTYPTLPEGMIRELLPESKAVYLGPASPVGNRACQSLRMANISAGHSAYVVDSMHLFFDCEGIWLIFYRETGFYRHSSHSNTQSFDFHHALAFHSQYQVRKSHAVRDSTRTSIRSAIC